MKHGGDRPDSISCLSVACLNGHQNIAELLLAHNAEINPENNPMRPVSCISSIFFFLSIVMLYYFVMVHVVK